METLLPADLSTEDMTALSDLEEQLLAEFDAAYDAESVDTALLAELADAIDMVRTEKQSRQEAIEAEAAAIDALRDRVHPADEPIIQIEDETDVPGEVPPEEVPPEEVPPEEEDEAEKAKELVHAGVKPVRGPSAAAIRNRAPAQDVGTGKPDVEITITAAADIPGYATSAVLTHDDIAVAMHAKAYGLGDRSPRLPVARITTPVPKHLIIDEKSNADAIIAAACQVKDAKSLIASGGWCAPSEVLFDQFAIESRDGLFDLPTVGIRRGGVRVPSFYSLSDTTGALWTWSETNDTGALTAQTVTNKALTSNVATITTSAAHGYVVGQTVVVDIGDPVFDGPHVILATPTSTTYTFAKTNANVTSAAATGTSQAVKGCLRIPCPTWTEYRLGAEGLCVTHGNLSDRAYPENTTRFVDLVMTAHLHRVSNAILAVLIAEATNVTITPNPSDTAGDLLSAIDMQVADMRSQYLLGDGTVLEAVFPQWVKGAIRSTMAMRAGISEMMVTDATITGWFTARNIRPQFVAGYQPSYATTPRVAWQTTVDFLIYVAGSYFKGDGGSIDLGVVRDSRLNETNDFTAAWSEQFYLVGRRGPVGRECTVALTTDGKTGGTGV